MEVFNSDPNLEGWVLSTYLTNSNRTDGTSDQRGEIKVGNRPTHHKGQRQRSKIVVSAEFSSYNPNNVIAQYP
jgi:hypothetical protein